MPGPAKTSDIQSRSFETLSTQQVAVATVLLEDAWTRIILQVPDIESRVLANPYISDAAKQVQTSMVLRVLSNPDGKLEEQGDDYRYRRDSAVSAGLLYVTDDELGLLAATSSRRKRGAFSITLAP